MNDSIEQLIYDPIRNGPLRTAPELAAAQRAELEEWRICGRVKVERCSSNPLLEGQRGDVRGCGREAKGGPLVIYVRLDGANTDSWFLPGELQVIPGS